MRSRDSFFEIVVAGCSLLQYRNALFLGMPTITITLSSKRSFAHRKACSGKKTIDNKSP